jgi:hypothetical protein
MVDPTQIIVLILVSFTTLGLLGLAADRFGVDSRESLPDDHRR